MSAHRSKLYGRLLGGVAAVSLLTAFGAHAEDLTQFDIAPQPLSSALNEFATQSKMAVLFTPDLTGTRLSAGLTKAAEPETALAMMLQGTGLSWKRNGDTFIIMDASDPQSAGAAGDGADAGTVQALIVTAQKREEDIQDVPIAISAFTQESLDQQHIEGGFDLLKAIPNVTFSKNNFTSYNFSIRGVGTKAISATTDPGVAVAFNNTGLIVNRLFEQEYFDIERVEVLRGPQGTLYGRNATAGVINVISAKPNLHEFSGWLKGEVGNYHTKRLSAMVNIPLVEDKLAIRIAGAMTDRQGYDYNSITKHHINGRDLWSGRLTIGFNPTERFRSNLVWERFNEDDDRSRTGKQLCHRDEGPLMIGSASTAPIPGRPSSVVRRAIFSQGCKPGSLYNDDAFGTVNGLALPFILFPTFYGGDCGAGCSSLGALGRDANGHPQTFIQPTDPYGGRMQSRNLREIASVQDPIYRAKADIVELNAEFDLSDALTLVSQTAYDKDSVYSIQDYNRFNTDPVFTDTSTLNYGTGINGDYHNLAPGGIFCDPQLGCSNRIAGLDQSSGYSKQFSQELRLQSDFDGPVNFSVGANYTRFQTQIDYYVFYNLITMLAMTRPFNKGAPGTGVDITRCPYSGFRGGLLGGFAGDGPVAIDDPRSSCPYIDPNPVESINGQGHNYFRSSNPYKLASWAGFGEVYWNVRDDLKVTAGLRYTDDRKTFTPVPSQLLLAYGFTAAGTTSIGYPEKPDIKQHWGEWTGRLGVDWKPDLSFTDDTLLYAFYSHGYKGGGANPPSPGFATYDEMVAQGTANPADAGFYNTQILLGNLPPIKLTAVEYGPTFKPEFINAFEIGSKNTLLQGAMTFNATAFYYDYKDYQVSQIRDRTAINENFDATVWGLEFETLFAPSRNLRINANLGYMDTRIADGETSIDTMNRTQGDPNYVIAKPWVQLPSNCVVPAAVAERWLLANPVVTTNYWNFCGGLFNNSSNAVIDPNPAFGGGTAPYNVNNYPELNGGAGLKAQLGGNDLPNAPHWTMNIGAQYGFDILDGSWRMTVRGDAYWQSQSWARVYNLDPYDKLHGWYNANLSVWFERPDDGLKIELYAKNLLDDTPITDSFLNSDDSGLTTNVFTLDPRLIGLSIRKEF